MSFALHFDSNKNTEKLNISLLESFNNINDCHKFDRLVFDSYFNQPIPRLPHFIKHIELGYYFNEDLSNIGEYIETIIFQGNEFNVDMSKLPKGLKEIKIMSDKIISKIENINIELKKICIQSENFNSELKLTNTKITSIIINSRKFNKNLLHLPLGLKELELYGSYNCSLNNLPSCLEYLKISSDIFNQTLDNLPRSLKTLILDNMDNFNHPLNNLPHGIETLKLNFGYFLRTYSTNNIYKYSMENLPSSIKYLSLSNYWGDLNTIIDNILDLDIWFPPSTSMTAHTHLQHWNKLPTQLEKLNINKEIAYINPAHNMIDSIKHNLNLHNILVNDVLM